MSSALTDCAVASRPAGESPTDKARRRSADALRGQNVTSNNSVISDHDASRFNQDRQIARNPNAYELPNSSQWRPGTGEILDRELGLALDQEQRIAELQSAMRAETRIAREIVWTRLNKRRSPLCVPKTRFRRKWA